MEHDFFSALTVLLLVLDPLGNIPIMLSTLQTVEEKRRRRVLIRELLIAFFLLLIFMLLGDHFLHVMRLSERSLSVSGGVILFIVAIKMIFPSNTVLSGTNQKTLEPFIVPLAIPLIAGPSALATCLLLASRQPAAILTWISGLTAAMAITGVVLLSAESIQKRVGPSVISAMERLMGLILAAIATKMVLSGIAKYMQA